VDNRPRQRRLDHLREVGTHDRIEVMNTLRYELVAKNPNYFFRKK